jgi:hypothetical protein
MQFILLEIYTNTYEAVGANRNYRGRNNILGEGPVRMLHFSP